jgi:hypothetical protein
MTRQLLGLLLIASLFAGLGGCVYDPAYYHRSGVVYDDERGGYAEPYYDSYYAAGPYYYDPWYYGYGYPSIGLGFSYYGGHRGGHYHGGHHSYHHSGSNTYHHH